MKEHAFTKRPYQTMVGMSVPVLLTVIADPLAGLADTAFVKELGAESIGGVGAAAAVVSGVLWILNFLAVGIHTKIAALDGAGQENEAGKATAVALAMAVGFGTILALLLFLFSNSAIAAMGAVGEMAAEGRTYLHVRVLSIPFWLLTVVCFGALRGVQDMKTSVWIAGGVDLLNVALDPLFIFGLGNWDGLGVAGAAWATVLSQILGAGIAVSIVHKRFPIRRPEWSQMWPLLRVGRDMFLRTGFLTAFLLLGTRRATSLGVGEAAAHQAIRQVWLLTAYVLDSVAISAQSLVGFFLGAGLLQDARKVAGVTVICNLFVGTVITLVLWLGEPFFLGLFST